MAWQDGKQQEPWRNHEKNEAEILISSDRLHAIEKQKQLVIGLQQKLFEVQ